VDTRASMTPHDYTAIGTMETFANRVLRHAGLSMNLELVFREERFGGNGPLMAGGLANLGVRTTYIGGVGQDDNPMALHAAYTPFASRCAEVVPIASTARTDAIEFRDGKVMLNKPGPMGQVTWDRIIERVGLEGVRARVRDVDLLAMVNWSIVAGVEDIWDGLIRDVLPSSAPRRLFLDLSDPAKRTDADIMRALGIVARLQQFVPVTLGLNHAEARRLCAVLSLDEPARVGPELVRAASQLRERMGIACVVIHPREGAAGCDGSVSTWVDGPFTPFPRLSTGAGDHFNAGFAFAQCLGLGLSQCLAVGVATSGAYVRDAQSPTRARLCAFLRALPEPEGPCTP
jgi:sugar/nucleoside kinase (ribokinase family)